MMVSQFNISPSEFWGMSFGEVRAISGANSKSRGPKPLSRNELDKLMELYPD